MHYVVWSALTYGVIVLVEAEIKKTTENEEGKEEGKEVGSYIASGIANAMNALTCCTFLPSFLPCRCAPIRT